MNLANILHIVGMLPTVISTVESARKGATGPAKKEDVKRAVLGSTATMQALGTLTVRDRKGFDKGLDKVIDGVVAMLNASEWKG